MQILQNEGLEEGEFLVDQAIAGNDSGSAGEVLGPVSVPSGPTLETPYAATGARSDSIIHSNSAAPNPQTSSNIPAAPSIRKDSDRQIQKPAGSMSRLGGFVGKLSLREAKRMARLKKQTSSSRSGSRSMKRAAAPAGRTLSQAGSASMSAK